MSLIKKIIYSGVVLIVFLIFLEAILRFLSYRYDVLGLKLPYTFSDNIFTSSLFEYDSRLGWKNKPNSYSLIRIADSISHAKINSFGFRDSETLSPKKSPTKTRIMFYGDSYTWGHGVNDEEIFTEKLKELFKQRKTEIINSGVSGYGTDQEFLFFKQSGFKWSPDIVVVMLFTRDIEADNISSRLENGYNKPYFQITPDGHLKLMNTPVPKLKNHLSKEIPYYSSQKIQYRFLIYTFFVQKFQSLKYALLKSNKTVWQWSLKLRQNEHQLGSQVTQKIFELFNQEVKKIGAKLIVVSVYQDIHLKKNPSAAMFSMKEFFHKNNITYLDSYDTFYEASKKNSLYFKHDPHWNTKGHEVMANFLHEQLKQYLIENHVFL